MTRETSLRPGSRLAFQFAITASGTMIMQSAINLFGSVAVAALYGCGEAPESCDPGHDRHGTDDGDLRGQNYGSGDVKPDQVRRAICAPRGICLLRCRSGTDVRTLKAVSRALLYRRRRPWGYDAVGKTYCYMTAVFSCRSARSLFSATLCRAAVTDFSR